MLALSRRPDASAQAVRERYRKVLAAAGRRRAALEAASAEELRRIGELAVGALAAGMSLSEIARLTNTSRPTLYGLRNDLVEAAEAVDFQILSCVAGHGAVAVTHLAGMTRRPEPQIEARCSELVAEGFLERRGSVGYDRQDERYFGLTDRGSDHLNELMTERGELPEETFFAYVPIDPGDAKRVYTEASSRIHPAEFALIAAGTTGDMATPELALQVRAPSEFDANLRATAVFGDILRAAGVSGRIPPMRINRRSPG